MTFMTRLHSSFVVGRSSFDVGRSSLVVGRSTLVALGMAAVILFGKFKLSIVGGLAPKR